MCKLHANIPMQLEMKLAKRPNVMQLNYIIILEMRKLFKRLKTRCCFQQKKKIGHALSHRTNKKEESLWEEKATCISRDMNWKLTSS